jgi:endoglucanase
VFLDGNRYAREFTGFGEPFDNAVYAVHQYPAPGGAGGGPYPGLTAGVPVDRAAVEAEFLSLTAYPRRHDLPVWVGEFGPVYGAGPERDAQRRRLLADQLGLYEAAGAGWSLWTYKDIGVQGLVVPEPGSPWLARTAAVRARKAAVAADHWGMTSDGLRDVLDPLLARLAREFPGYDPYPYGARRMAERLVREILFAEPLGGEFAACFAGASDEQLTALGESFAFSRCVVQRELCDVVAGVAGGRCLQGSDRHERGTP